MTEIDFKVKNGFKHVYFVSGGTGAYQSAFIKIHVKPMQRTELTFLSTHSVKRQ